MKKNLIIIAMIFISQTLGVSALNKNIDSNNDLLTNSYDDYDMVIISKF